MVRYIYIPQQVKDDIKNHLDKAIEKAIKGYASAYEDEDVLTGHLFGLMKSDEHVVSIDDQEIGGNWKWSIDYKKFRGRGKKATEKIIGADGIFELHLFRDGRTQSKSLLFQSKLDWRTKDNSLYIQCSKLLTWLGASTIINYTQDEFETYKIEEIFSHKGEKPNQKKSLKKLLGEDFLDCNIGDSDLKYDAFQKKLTWLDINNQLVSTKFNVNRSLKIKIKAPKEFPMDKRKIDMEIPNEEISKHILKNENVDFKIYNIKDDKELKKIQRKVSLTFHPDKHPSLQQEQKLVLTDLMKYFNNMFDKQKEKIKHRS